MLIPSIIDQLHTYVIFYYIYNDIITYITISSGCIRHASHNMSNATHGSPAAACILGACPILP